MSPAQSQITAAMLLVAVGIVAKRNWVTKVQNFASSPVGSTSASLVTDAATAGV